MDSVIYKKQLKELLESIRLQQKSIGFVPTMGALHKGHAALVTKAKAENNLVVVSIFVNPTQFNDKTDLEKYPRTLAADKQLLEQIGCDIVFIPEVKEIYPEKDTRIFNFGSLEKVMEGAHRPGHFNGVAQVLSKFFEITGACKAYFGQKDFQQVAIVKALVKQQNYPVTIVTCSTVREIDGLAMSSRNLRLTAEERAIAPLIYSLLLQIKERSASESPAGLKLFMEKELKKHPKFKLEYIEIADAATLQPLNDLKGTTQAVACIAVTLGSVRLIDNILL